MKGTCLSVVIRQAFPLIRLFLDRLVLTRAVLRFTEQSHYKGSVCQKGATFFTETIEKQGKRPKINGNG